MTTTNKLGFNQEVKESQNLLTRAEAAKYLRVSVAFLERAAWSGIPGIIFYKVGDRAVRYKLSDLEAYLESRIHKSTKEQEALRS